MLEAIPAGFALADVVPKGAVLGGPIPKRDPAEASLHLLHDERDSFYAGLDGLKMGK